MGKHIKAQPANVGRVPLVQDGKPLLYPRYNTIEELLNIGKRDNSLKDDGVEDRGTGDRPSKKQKTAGAAGEPVDGNRAEAASIGKGYGVVGEDGLTYKQRRQLRRATERAAKERAEAGTEAAAEAASPAGALAPEPGTAAQPDNNGHIDKKAKEIDEMKDKKGRKAEDANGVTETVAVNGGEQGNADEAARMRAVLGFTRAPGSEGEGALQLAALAATSGAAADAANSDGVAPDPVTLEKKEKKEEKDKTEESSKKRKKSAAEEQGKKRQRDEAGPNGMPAERGTSPPGEPPQKKSSVEVEGKAATAVADAAGQRSGGGGNKLFSFNFQLQAAVEAETEVRLARLMALDSTKDGFVPRRIWVCGMPHEFDEDTIREYWGYCGEIESLHLLTFPDSGNFNGTAYITFKTQEAYEAALACHGELLEGRALRVEKCKAAAELKGKARISAATVTGSGVDGRGSGGGNGRVAGYPVVYCGNVAFEVGAEELQQLFSRAGAVPSKVRLHVDKASGRSKGYAHVHFASDEDVDKAVALDGASLHGRRIRVSYAQPKLGEC